MIWLILVGLSAVGAIGLLLARGIVYLCELTDAALRDDDMEA